jgi:hypothetical protein
MINRKIKFNEVIFQTGTDEKRAVYYGTWTTGAILDDLAEIYGDVTLVNIDRYEKTYEVAEPEFIKIAKEI